jgi:hypothetical protein
MKRTPTTVSTQPKMTVAMDEFLDVDMVLYGPDSERPDARRGRSYRMRARGMKVEPMRFWRVARFFR